MAYRLILLLSLVSISAKLCAQNELLDMEAPEALENIKLVKLSTSAEASSFVIWVKDTVRPHYHAEHTENLYVLDGKGIMYLDSNRYELKPGDFYTIPKKSVHSVKVHSKIPLKVLSIQAPEFFGKDRIFVE